MGDDVAIWHSGAGFWVLIRPDEPRPPGGPWIPEDPVGPCPSGWLGSGDIFLSPTAPCAPAFGWLTARGHLPSFVFLLLTIMTLHGRWGEACGGVGTSQTGPWRR